MIARRAQDKTAKDKRRQTILAAADRLYGESHVLPTVARIAPAAGLAKGTIYLYFDNREEIFLALLLEGWIGALDDLEANLVSHRAPSIAIAGFLNGFVDLVQSRPSLMALDAMQTEFKASLSDAARSGFDTALHARLERTGGILEEMLQLPPGRGMQLLVRTHAFARGLWQSFHAPDSCDHAKTGKMPPLADELRQALAEYWRGALDDHGSRIIITRLKS